MVNCENCTAVVESGDLRTTHDGKPGCDECAVACDKCDAVIYSEGGRYIDDGSEDFWCIACIVKKYDIPTG